MLSTLLHQTGLQQVQSMYTHQSKEKFGYLQLLVCAWRHGGVLVVKKKKHFSPLGTKLYFHVNSSKKNSVVLTTNRTTNMAALSHGYCKPRIRLRKTGMWKELECLRRVGLKVDCKTVRIFAYSSTLYARTLKHPYGVWGSRELSSRAWGSYVLFSPLNHFWEKKPDCFAV